MGSSVSMNSTPPAIVAEDGKVKYEEKESVKKMLGEDFDEEKHKVVEEKVREHWPKEGDQFKELTEEEYNNAYTEAIKKEYPDTTEAAAEEPKAEGEAATEEAPKEEAAAEAPKEGEAAAAEGEAPKEEAAAEAPKEGEEAAAEAPKEGDEGAAPKEEAAAEESAN